ncbi:hypothetical protein MRX96_056590 [Rhipicephalus microplus]
MDSVLLSLTSSPASGSQGLSDGWMPPGHPAQDAERRQEPDLAGSSGPAQDHLLPKVDTSYPDRWLRYTSFVVTMAATMSATLFTLARRAHGGRHVHPCDDFYGHVCGGWERTGIRYTSPLSRYKSRFSRSIVNRILLEHIPKRPTNARERAAGFLFRCLSRTEKVNTTTFTTFLNDRGLPWPEQIFYDPISAPGHPCASISAVRHAHVLGLLRRRCAEIVGRTSQSYSLMIQQVLQTHAEIVELVLRFWGRGSVPQYHNMSDPDLRRAVNGYLPDDSQLWPVDEIVNMQPEFFSRLDATHLRKTGYQERFKLFLGAYVVWALSPMVSTYLTNSMLADMNRLSTADDYPFLQMHRGHGGADAARQLAATPRRPGGSRAHVECSAVVGARPERLDGRCGGHHTVSTTCRESSLPDCIKRSVGREVILPHFLTSWPLYEPWHPPSVLSALGGITVTTQVLSMLRFAIYYDSRFRAYGFENLQPGPRALGEDVHRFEKVLRASDELPDASKHEFRMLYEVSIAAHTASRMPQSPEWQPLAPDPSLPAATPESKQNSFWSFKPEQLFFYLACFMHCGAWARERKHESCPVQRRASGVATFPAGVPMPAATRAVHELHVAGAF